MKRKLCSLLLLAVFVCSILTACGGSSQPNTPVSGPSNAQTTGTPQRDALTVQLDSMTPYSYKTGTGTRIYTSNGYVWDYTYYYRLRIDLTIKNTGDIANSINRSLFGAYWDDKELSLESFTTDNAQLTPNEETSVSLVYSMSEEQYNNWNMPGHIAKLVIRYGNDSLTYTYISETGDIKVS